MPLILAKPQLAYTAITVATCQDRKPNGYSKIHMSQESTLHCSLTQNLKIWSWDLTSWAMIKALTNRRPGRSTKHQLRDLVTKIRAWLTMLTCRYNAAIISSSLCLNDRTLNLSCQSIRTLLVQAIYIQGKKHLKKKAYREEISVFHCPEEYDSHQCQIATQNNSSCKNLLKFPTVWQWRWLHTILWDSHDCTWHYQMKWNV